MTERHSPAAPFKKGDRVRFRNDVTGGFDPDGSFRVVDVVADRQYASGWRVLARTWGGHRKARACHGCGRDYREPIWVDACWYAPEDREGRRG